MSRIVRSQPPNRARETCLQEIRALLQPSEQGAAAPGAERERLVLIVDRLGEIEASVEQTAEAWEQRGYWAKADTFRRTWSWVGPTRAALLQSLHEDSPASADNMLAGLLVRLFQLGVRPRSGPALATRNAAPKQRLSDPDAGDT